MENLKAKAFDLRKDAVDIIVAGKGGHIGGDMSVMDILISLYFCQMNVSPDRLEDPDRDRFVLSKGHSVEAYYAVLAAKGFLDLEDVKANFSKFGSKYIGHPNNKLPGIEMNSGSLGHGLPVCVGMALAGKMDHKDYRVYTLLGDGEIEEGQVWEAAMFAAHYQLDNLCAIVDNNGLQIDGPVDQVMSPYPITDKFAAFGWNVLTVDAHDFDQLEAAFNAAKTVKGKPTVIVQKSVKGKGVSFMENQVSWHGAAPNAEQYETAMTELKAALAALEAERV